MVASSIPCKLSLCADRAHARAGDSYVSSAINVACPTTQSVLAIASPHELRGNSWPSPSTGISSFCCNQQYSVTAVTTSAGAIAERYAYSAYGQPTILDASASVLSSSAINNRYTYTGREWDSTLGLHHFRARWISPIAGRFLGRDPIGYVESTSIYLLNTSLKQVDPSGRMTLTATRIEGIDQSKAYCSEGNNNRRYVFRYFLSEKPSCDGWLIREVCVNCGIAACECNGPPKPKDFFEPYCYYEAERIFADDYKGQNGQANMGDDVVAPPSLASVRTCGKYSQRGSTIFLCDEQLRKLMDGLPNAPLADDFPETWKKDRVFGPEECQTTSGSMPSIKERPQWWVKAISSKWSYAVHVRSQAWEWCCCGDNKEYWTSKSKP